MKKILLLLSLIVALGLLAVQFGNQAGIASAQEPEATVEVPFLEAWMGSPHNDAEAAAFTNWDEDSPPEIPVACAKCHSTPGYQDFLGVDGTDAGVVDNAAPVGTTVACVACHNEATLTKTSVVMPSGVEITDLGDEARCIECHRARFHHPGD